MYKEGDDLKESSEKPKPLVIQVKNQSESGAPPPCPESSAEAEDGSRKSKKKEEPMQSILSYMSLMNIETADVSIYCKDGTLLGHKLVLASISPMLYGALKDHGGDDSEETTSILIPDVSVEQMKAYLHQVYECQSLSMFPGINDMIRLNSKLLESKVFKEEVNFTDSLAKEDFVPDPVDFMKSEAIDDVDDDELVSYLDDLPEDAEENDPGEKREAIDYSYIEKKTRKKIYRPCFVCGKGRTGIFSLPKDDEKKLLWCQILNMPVPPASKVSRLCPQHFRQSDISRPENSRYRRKIKKNALPLPTNLLKSESTESSPVKLSFTREEGEDMRHYPKHVSPIYDYFDLDPNDQEAISKFDQNARMKCRLCQKTYSKPKCMGHLRNSHGLLGGTVGSKKNSKGRKCEEFYEEDPNNSNNVICKFCQKSCSYTNFEKHLITMHEDLVKHKLKIPKFQCSFCSHVFKTKWNLQLHETTHEEKPSGYQKRNSKHWLGKTRPEYHEGVESICDECGKKFPSPTLLKFHLKASNNKCNLSGKPFACTVCDKHFSRETRLEYHMRTHTGEKPHQCQDCGQFFKYYHRLNYHNCVNGAITKYLNNYYTKDADGLYACNLCDYRSKHRNSLGTHHRRVHEGLTFPCNKCDHKASSLGNLTTHIRAKHEGVRYPCHLCDYKATQPNSLQTHIRAVHEGVKLSCNFCDYKASQQHSLKRHVQAKHPDMIEMQ